MTKIPQFVEIKSAGARTGSEYMAITKNGTFSLYSGFYPKVKSFSKCIILVDKKQKLIGLQFGNEELGKGAYSVIHGEKTASVYAGNVFENNGLDIQEWYGKYPPEKYEDSARANVYMIDLDDKIKLNRKPNKKQLEKLSPVIS